MRRGFTVVEAIAAGAVVAFLAGSLGLATLSRSREMANRGVCAANLRGIVQSMAVYGASEADAYPCLPPPDSATAYDAAFKPELSDTSDADKAQNSLFKDNKHSASPAESLWILVMNGSVSTKQFLCRSDPFASTPAAGTGPVVTVAGANHWYLNFQNENNLSYSVPYPWTVDKDNKVVVSGLWRNNTDASLPVMADMAPYLGSKAKAGEAATRPAGSDAGKPVDADWAVTRANAQNHQFDGQNVAFGDCHVEFVNNPKVGQNRDSIWGIQKEAKGSFDNHGFSPAETVVNQLEIPIEAGTLPHAPMGSQGQEDVVMVPTRDAQGHLK